MNIYEVEVTSLNVNHETITVRAVNIESAIKAVKETDNFEYEFLNMEVVSVKRTHLSTDVVTANKIVEL